MLGVGCVILIAPLGFFYLFRFSIFFGIFLCIFGDLILAYGVVTLIGATTSVNDVVFHVLVTLNTLNKLYGQMFFNN